MRVVWRSSRRPPSGGASYSAATRRTRRLRADPARSWGAEAGGDARSTRLPRRVNALRAAARNPLHVDYVLKGHYAEERARPVAGSYSRREAMVVRLCSMVFRKRLRKSGTISLIGPLARASIDSRRRVAAPPCSGANSTRWCNRKGPNCTSHAADWSGSYSVTVAVPATRRLPCRRTISAFVPTPSVPGEVCLISSTSGSHLG